MHDITDHDFDGEELSAEALDPVLEALKRDIDFTLVERNLGFTTEQRAQQLINATRFIGRFRPLVAGGSGKSA